MNSIYEMVTTHIVHALTQGVIPWRKPWSNAPLPVNAISKRAYRGVNVFLLGITPYRDHRWLTLKQANELGGSVCKGEKSSVAIFWKRLEPSKEESDGQGETGRGVPLHRYYRVFNVEQCTELRLGALETKPELDLRIAKAEELIRSVPTPPSIREVGNLASYNPRLDLVCIPSILRFAKPDEYYATLFHELGHATGHKKRLNRPGLQGEIHFGSCEYSREELVAELTSAYCCATAGLDNSMLAHSAGYIGGWLRALKADPKAIVIAAAHAQRAADYIRNIQQPE